MEIGEPSTPKGEKSIIALAEALENLQINTADEVVQLENCIDHQLGGLIRKDRDDGDDVKMRLLSGMIKALEKEKILYGKKIKRSWTTSLYETESEDDYEKTEKQILEENPEFKEELEAQNNGVEKDELRDNAESRMNIDQERINRRNELYEWIDHFSEAYKDAESSNRQYLNRNCHGSS